MLHGGFNVAMWLTAEICAKQWSRWGNPYHYFHTLHVVLRQLLLLSPSPRNGSLPPQTFFTGLVVFSLYYCKHILILLL